MEGGKLSRHESFEYTRIMQMLDYRQQLNLAAHLYSAHTISKRPVETRRGKRQVPFPSWTAWPLADAPKPPECIDAIPDNEPKEVTDESLEELGTAPEQSAEEVLLAASEEFLQREIHRRIHSDRRSVELEPIVEPEPELSPQLAARIVQIVDKYAVPRRLSTSKPQLIKWNQLGIRGPAADRLQRLLNSPVNEATTVLSDESETDGAEGYEESSGM